MDTSVLFEKWILDGVLHSPLSLQQDVDLSLMVSYLWDEQIGRWDTGKIRQLFVEKDANYILILRYLPDMEDTYVWGYTDDGEYTTKSGYKLAKRLGKNSEPDNREVPPIERDLQSKVWKAKTMPKIRHFM